MKITAINHLAFITPDMTATVHFYRDLLGMELRAGVGHDGFRHYFLKFGDCQVAFFEYEGASAMERKFHGVPTRKPLGFDHVSFTVASCAELFELKDRMEAAGFEITGPVDHGTIWSIYFFDPNNIPLEVSWEFMEIDQVPAITDDDPLPVAAEGAAPNPAHWPAVARPTPPQEWVAKPGNGHRMREDFLARGIGHLSKEYEDVVATAADRGDRGAAE